MKKNKNRLVRAMICIGVSVLLLTMAVFANYDNASGYSEIKNAVKNMMYTDNGTANINAEAVLDGVNIAKFDIKMMLDKNSDVKMYVSSMNSVGDYYDTSEETVQDGYKLKSYTTDNSDFSRSSKYKYKMSPDSFPMNISKDNEMLTKGVNFVETLCDTLVGDIKNNIVLASTDGGSKTYSINMNGEQLPKYMTAAFSFMCAGMRANDDLISDKISEPEKLIKYMFMNPKEPYVNSINGMVTIDENNRITDFDGALIITGYDKQNEAKDIKLNLRMTAGDFDITTIPRVNADEYEEIGTYESYSMTYDEDADVNVNVSAGM